MDILSILIESENPEVGIFLGDCLAYGSKISRLSTVRVSSVHHCVEGGDNGVHPLPEHSNARLHAGSGQGRVHRPSSLHLQESAAHHALRRFP